MKIKDFGKKADPLNKLRAIKKYATHFSNEELHQRISGVFTQLHDLHTNYIAPKPLSCAATFIPLKFESVLDELNWKLFKLIQTCLSRLDSNLLDQLYNLKMSEERRIINATV